MAGCEQCTSGDSCDKCSTYTNANSGQCECEFKTAVTSRPGIGYILIDVYYLKFNTSAFDLYEGKYNCTQLFNFTGNTSEYDLEDLTCSAQYFPSAVKGDKSRIQITSPDKDLLYEIARENIQIALLETLLLED